MAKNYQTHVTVLPSDKEAKHKVWDILKGLTNDLFISFRDEKRVIVKNKVGHGGGGGETLEFILS